MIILLILVTALVMWSLQLMQTAFNHREFSFMLAGTLVAISAAGLIVIYFLMEGYMGYMTNAVRYQLPLDGTGIVGEAEYNADRADISLFLPVDQRSFWEDLGSSL